MRMITKVISTSECNTAAKKNEVDPYVLVWKGFWDMLLNGRKKKKTHKLQNMYNMILFVL